MIHELADDHKEHLRTLGVSHIPDHLDIPEEEYEEHAAAWRRTHPDADDDFIHKKVLGHHASKQHSRIFEGIPPTHLADSKTIEDAKNKEIMAARADVWKMSEVHFPALKKELDDIEEAVKSGNSELKGARTEIGAAIAAASGAIVGALNMNQSGIEKIAKDMRLDRAEDRQLFERFGWGILTLLFLLIVATLFAPRAHAQFSKINSVTTKNSGSALGFHASPFVINCSTNVTCTDDGYTFAITSSGGAATGYQTIKNAAVAITQRTVLNWTAVITCVDNAGTAASDCTVAPASASAAGIVTTGTQNIVGLKQFGAIAGFTTDTQAYVDEAQQVGISSLNAITPTLSVVNAVSVQDNSTNPAYASYFEIEGTSSSGTRAVVEAQGADAFQSGAGTVTDLIGGAFRASTLPGAGALTNSSGIKVDIDNGGLSTISNAYGMHIGGFTKSGGGTITTAYGLNIGDQSAATTNYAIHTGLGTVSFGDHVDASGQKVTAAEYDSDQSNIATNGTIRLNKLDFIGFRNELNNGNINLSKDTSDRIASSGGFAGALTGNVTGNVTGALTGNADTATTLATTRAIYGNNFNGSAALTQIIASTFGGTGNGFTKFSGATTSEKTYSLPDATTTILTTNAAVTVGQGGTGQSTTATSGRYLKGDGSNWGTSTGSASGVGTPTACTNQFVTALTLNSDAAPTSTCTTATLAGAQFANQGTTTTVLHGNGAGNPSFGAVVEADQTLANNTTNDVSITKHGYAPIAPNDTTKFLRGDATWAVATAVAAAGGSDTQMQYNDATALNGAANFLYTKASGLITANQKADTAETIQGKRFTDTTPTGDFFKFTDAAGTGTIGKLDVLGTFTLGGTGTGLASITTDNITTTPTDAVVLKNTTAATSGVAVQDSPQIHWTGHVWNTTATAADNAVDFTAYVIPTSGTTPSALWKLRKSMNGGAFADAMTVSDTSVVTATSFVGGLDASGASTTTGLKVPTGAGAAPTANGTMAYDSTGNHLSIGINGTNFKTPFIVASGTSTFTNTAAGTLTCQTTVTTAATGAATTDTIEWTYSTAPVAATDGRFEILPYLTANNVNFMRCNNTAASVTPTALTINWKVIR